MCSLKRSVVGVLFARHVLRFGLAQTVLSNTFENDLPASGHYKTVSFDLERAPVLSIASGNVQARSTRAKAASPVRMGSVMFDTLLD